jgi:hypothetical protein
MNKIILSIIFVVFLIGMFILNNITVNFLLSETEPGTEGTIGQSAGSNELLGFSHSVSVSTKRNFMFGLFSLPVYANGINILQINMIFILISLLGSAFFVHAL